MGAEAQHIWFLQRQGTTPGLNKGVQAGQAPITCQCLWAQKSVLQRVPYPTRSAHCKSHSY